MYSCRLLGQDHVEYGVATTSPVGDKAAASLSVGADQQSPSLEFKGQRDLPNEDALFVIDDGRYVVMAVADAHFGHESSSLMIERLHTSTLASLPTTGAALQGMVEGLGDAPDPETSSESTLLVALFDRQEGCGSVVNFGDSTLAVVTAAGQYRNVNVKDNCYVSTGHQWPAGAFSVDTFTAEPGDHVLMFTDGVDECHYRHPETSIRPRHIAGLVNQHAAMPAELCQGLVTLALSGVDGHPGGQDNIALIVAQA